MLTLMILSLLFFTWAVFTAVMLCIGCIYGCIFGIIDLILLSPFILLATPFVIAAVVILIVVLVKKKKAKKAIIEADFDVV